jgi:phage terminase large subunit-like protein
VQALTRGERVIRFIESYCVVPEGDYVGQPVRLAEFQKLFILAIYDNPEITDTALLSIARKNSKTATIAFILLAHIFGPEALQNSRIVSGAMSREQAAEVYNLASKCIQLAPKLRDIGRIVPSQKRIIGMMHNVEYQAISAEGKTAHGKSPVLAILDEVGQIRGPRSDFVDAITTAQGAYKNPLLIYISTQAANDGDLFSIAIDDAKTNKPPKTVCHVYAAAPDADVLDEQAWRDANPALGLFRSMEDMRKQAEKASRMPTFENTFRNLNLNQRVSTSSPYVSRAVWESCGGAIDSLDGLTVFGGLDLSSKTDLTCLVLAGHGPDGVWHVVPVFWMPEKNILERAHEDRVPYDIWRNEGFLRTTPGATVDYKAVLQDMATICDGLDIAAIGFDRWRIDIFKRDMEELGLSFPLIEHGQGYKDMAPALDALDEVLLNGRLRHGMHPVLTMCAGNATVEKDSFGNRKLTKTKASGRIDGMVALAMAMGTANKMLDEPEMPFDDALLNPLVL